jgi:hypothetical protein
VGVRGEDWADEKGRLKRGGKNKKKKKTALN